MRVSVNIGAVCSALAISTVLSLGWGAAVQGNEGGTATVEPTPTSGESSTPGESPSPDGTTTASPSDPGSETPTGTPTGTPTETASPTPAPVTKGWAVERFDLEDGRSYYARVATCAPLDAPECVTYLGRRRQVLVFLHGFGGREDAEGAQMWLDHFATMRRTGDTVFVFGVSQDGSKAWNAGYCCTFDETDDVDYLVRTVGDLATRTTVNSARVGLFGLSNGGMMALRGACERPDVFDAGISWAGTYGGACDAPGVKVAQMHGALDTVVPVNGGSSTIGGRVVTIPPAAETATRMSKGAVFPLTVYPGFGHFPNWSIQWLQVRWLSASLTG